MIFHAHVDLLLAHYDELDWGAWETKVVRCVPAKKQQHLLEYFVPANLESYEKAIKKWMINFNNDAIEVCEEKNLEYPTNVANQVISYFNREITNQDKG
jgi:hypothetical protein